MENEKLIYIAGYSRSGSTVLDVLLGSHPDLFSCGELTYLLEDAQNAERSCTCGAKYTECPTWGQFKLKGSNDAQMLRAVERRRFGSTEGDLECLYASYMSRLLAEVRRVTGCRILVDSSKNSKDPAFRMERLKRLCGENVYVVHTVRDYLATMSSYHVNGSNWAQEGYGKEKHFLLLRSSIGWMLANSIAWWLGRRMNYMVIDHNRFLKDPKSVVEALGQFLSEDFSPIISRIEQGELFYAEHNVGGNRARQQGVSISSRRIVKKPDVPFWVRLFRYVCGPKVIEHYLFRSVKDV